MRDQIIRLILGDCFEQLRKLPDASVGAVVTDPPYFYGFMGRAWDKSDDPMAFHRDWLLEAFRVLQPGGIIKVFSGTRTKHRLEAAIEAVGFILVGECGWLQGQGFPKSLDVGKAVGEHLGAEQGPEAQLFEGWGTALKPSFEPFCLGRKPLT
ncbi:MAG: hypothetical protein A2Y38_23615 [Spirochaetes bacterium GWB1_59_5]|nr:MAG: hypothetical protein A2Y38_23615 [Spirochaetes bacterium GWB1_59_5]